MCTVIYNAKPGLILTSIFVLLLLLLLLLLFFRTHTNTNAYVTLSMDLVLSGLIIIYLIYQSIRIQ